ncbi:MAG: hypothetical protein ACOZNI_20705 [Myxococcota bacterium]
MSSTIATPAAHAPDAGAALRAEGLPVAPGTALERERMGGLLAEARALGLDGARLHGLAAHARPHAEGALHAVLALVAFAAALLGSTVGVVGLALLAVEAVARTRGLHALAAASPRAPCWNLVLRHPGPRTRRVIVGCVDRARAAPWLPVALAVADLLAMGSLFLGATAGLVAAAALAGVGALAFALGRAPRPTPDSPEATAARSVLREAARLQAAGDEEVAVVLSGCAAERGEGIAAFCDWWALRRDRVEIVGVGLGDEPSRALARAGWTVRRETA